MNNRFAFKTGIKLTDYTIPDNVAFYLTLLSLKMTRRNDATGLSDLKKSIFNAIAVYKSDYPHRAASSPRSKNITDITLIVNDSQSSHDLLSRLEDYFSHNFYTGISDSSALEDLITTALLTTNNEMALGLNVFGYFPDNHPQSNEVPKGAKDEVIEIQYFLDDFINFAIDKYMNEKQGNIPKYRLADISKIRGILRKNCANQIDLIEQVLNQMTHSFNSDLKKYLSESLAHYQSNQSKKFATRTWEPENSSILRG